MTASIFISFASQDLKVANTLCKALESRGFKCWIASRDIAPGENFQIAIVRAIRNAKIMLLVFTGNSNNSDEMAKELALASQSKLIVVPLRIDDVRPNEAFSYEFATRQWIDFFADWETAIEQLAQRIGMALGDGANAAPPEPVAAPPAMPAPTPDVIMEALAAQPAEVANPLAAAPGEAAGKTALLTPAALAAAAKPAPASAGPSSLQPETPAKRGAPVMLFVALGVLLVALVGGAAVILPSFLAKKPEPTATAPTNAAASLALTPAPPSNPALVTQPTAAIPGPAPMASGTPDPGGAGTGPSSGYVGSSSEQPVQPSAGPSSAQEDPDLDPETHRGGRSHPRRGGGGGGGAGGGGSADVPF